MKTLVLVFASLVFATSITKAPDLQPRQIDPNSASCDSFTSFEAACASSTPGFLSLGPAKQLNCLCYRSSTWAPTTYESYYRGCLSYYKTASPALYKTLDGDALPTSWCSSASQLLLTDSSTSSNPPTTSSLSELSAACDSWSNLIATCNTRTSSFTSLAFAIQASCLCETSSSTYLYDEYWQSCVAYQKTAYPQVWTSLGGDDILQTPCAAAAGDLGTPTATGIPTGTASSSVPNPNAACSGKSNIMKSNLLQTIRNVLQVLLIAFHVL